MTLADRVDRRSWHTLIRAVLKRRVNHLTTADLDVLKWLRELREEPPCAK